mgnify:CR=1 FL=1
MLFGVGLWRCVLGNWRVATGPVMVQFEFNCESIT